MKNVASLTSRSALNPTTVPFSSGSTSHTFVGFHHNVPIVQATPPLAEASQIRPLNYFESSIQVEANTVMNNPLSGSELMQLCGNPAFMTKFQSLLVKMPQVLAEKFVEGLEQDELYEAIHKICPDELKSATELVLHSNPRLGPRILALEERISDKTASNAKMANGRNSADKASVKRSPGSSTSTTTIIAGGALLAQDPHTPIAVKIIYIIVAAIGSVFSIVGFLMFLLGCCTRSTSTGLSAHELDDLEAQSVARYGPHHTDWVSLHGWPLNGTTSTQSRRHSDSSTAGHLIPQAHLYRGTHGLGVHYGGNSNIV